MKAILAQQEREARRSSLSKEVPDAKRAKRETNGYLSQPIEDCVEHVANFLIHAYSLARNHRSKKTNLKHPLFEIEARLAILTHPVFENQRVVSSGPKTARSHDGRERVVQAFECSGIEPKCRVVPGISKRHFVKWAPKMLQKVSPVSRALGVTCNIDLMKLEEESSVETVYVGYPDNARVVFPGIHPSRSSVMGKKEYKKPLHTIDMTIPGASYDVRVRLAAEQAVADVRGDQVPAGWSEKRIKHRQTYTQKDCERPWRVDVTEVTTIYNHQHSSPSKQREITYELEIELDQQSMLKFLTMEGHTEILQEAKRLARRLWGMLQEINHISDVVDVRDSLEDHPDAEAVRLALSQCRYLRAFVDGGGHTKLQSPIGSVGRVQLSGCNSFVGSMPVNFTRHNLDKILAGPENDYFLSEKTDGLRHLLVFTGNKTAVLVDRKMKGGKRLKSKTGEDPFALIVPLVQPGAVFDGEVVMSRSFQPPRPVFIIFDILALSASEPVVLLRFEERLRKLHQYSFLDSQRSHDLATSALPLVVKKFYTRSHIDRLFNRIIEKRGQRYYQYRDANNNLLHNHLTDGIIFHPNRPYVCGPDFDLLKWKYLDTVTMDVELVNDQTKRNNAICVNVLGDSGSEGPRVDMSHMFHLPPSERYRLEADRAKVEAELRAKNGSVQRGNPIICEVGFDPSTGEWFYHTIRSDKPVPNKISTVLGAWQELAEGLTKDELRDCLRLCHVC